jgi:aminoacrylate hydrolase
MPKASIGDAEIYYEEQGAGPPLMMVPGLGGVGAIWKPQVEAFKAKFHCITHDHRGCGQSTRTKGGYTVERMADDTLRLMDALKIERAHFIGHSTGGAIGQIIALDHPERLVSLVLSATWAGPDPFFRRCFTIRRETLTKLGWESYWRVSNAFLYAPWYIAAHAAELAAQEAAQVANPPDLDIAVARIDAIVAFDRRAALGRITMPTLVIVAKDDMVTPLHLSQEIAKKIPNAKLVALEHGGHFVDIADPASYNKAVLDFLSTHA